MSLLSHPSPRMSISCLTAGSAANLAHAGACALSSTTTCFIHTATSIIYTLIHPLFVVPLSSNYTPRSTSILLPLPPPQRARSLAPTDEEQTRARQLRFVCVRLSLSSGGVVYWCVPVCSIIVCVCARASLRNQRNSTCVYIRTVYLFSPVPVFVHIDTYTHAITIASSSRARVYIYIHADAHNHTLFPPQISRREESDRALSLSPRIQQRIRTHTSRRECEGQRRERDKQRQQQRRAVCA